MKFCPYCGVSLPGDAASFCPECGKALPIKKTTGTQAQKKRPLPQHKPQRKPKQPPKQAPRRKPIDPMDVNYDGYYDDIKPVDAGTQGEGMDPELIKRAGLVVLGAVTVIILAAILMMLL